MKEIRNRKPTARHCKEIERAIADAKLKTYEEGSDGACIVAATPIRGRSAAVGANAQAVNDDDRRDRR